MSALHLFLLGELNDNLVGGLNGLHVCWIGHSVVPSHIGRGRELLALMACALNSVGGLNGKHVVARVQVLGLILQDGTLRLVGILHQRTRHVTVVDQNRDHHAVVVRKVCAVLLLRRQRHLQVGSAIVNRILIIVFPLRDAIDRSNLYRTGIGSQLVGHDSRRLLDGDIEDGNLPLLRSRNGMQANEIVAVLGHGEVALDHTVVDDRR